VGREWGTPDKQSLFSPRPGKRKILEKEKDPFSAWKEFQVAQQGRKQGQKKNDSPGRRNRTSAASTTNGFEVHPQSHPGSSRHFTEFQL
jgi:hypothetical protein